MPAPSRTSLQGIVRAAADLLEEGGPPALTMQAVATRVGVRAPSLYKHVGGRDDLTRLVAEQAVGEIAEAIEAVTDGPADAALRRSAHTLRDFARRRPAAFRLVFSPGSEATRPSPDLSAHAVAPVVRAAAELAGPEHALDAARTLTAWTSGFIAMELADAFRMGGDVDRAFAYGIDRIVAALAAGTAGDRSP